MADKTKDYDDIVASRQAVYRQPGFVAAMSDIMALQDPEIRARNLLGEREYGSITAPTLVLWTSDDPTADVSEGRRIASMIPGARFEVMPDCGHWPQYEDPETFNKLHLDFLLGKPRVTDQEADVVIVGAGPVGLTLANILGIYGVRTLVVDERDSLIDYPRGVGLDDESLRTFQSIGLVEEILPHTVPNQILRFYDGHRRLLAEMAPPDARFGWPKRNGFVQPLVDAQLLAGLDRFGHVQVAWGRRMETAVETADGVTVEFGPDRPAVQARYVVGCDGGRSATRRLMGVPFDGTTSSTRWVVVDLANDPLGHPNSEVGADPDRPYASISIAHGIRRFEFMIHADETDEQAEDPEFVARLLAPFVPHPDKVDVIRRRVYTHHSRIAGNFRKGRFLLAGDAAHLMPVWQGQGYNSGIRDAANLGWKLAAVVNGQAGDALLDTYDTERRKHARAMIDLSTLVGRRHLADQPQGRGGARQVDSRCLGGTGAQALRAGDAVQADAALRPGCGLPSEAADTGRAGRHVVHPAAGGHPRADRTCCSTT